MNIGVGIPVFSCKTKIDEVNLVAKVANTDKEVLRLEIAVNEIARVNILYS